MKGRKLSEARIRANHKYNAKMYDQLTIAIPKGRKSVIRSHATAHGESINRFVGRAIMEAMERDSTEQPNAETIAAIEELESGGGEHFTGSTEDFFRYLAEGEDE